MCIVLAMYTVINCLYTRLVSVYSSGRQFNGSTGNQRVSFGVNSARDETKPPCMSYNRNCRAYMYTVSQKNIIPNLW